MKFYPLILIADLTYFFSDSLYLGLNTALCSLGITFKGIYVIFPISKVSILPFYFISMADFLSKYLGADWTGMYVFPLKRIALVELLSIGM